MYINYSRPKHRRKSRSRGNTTHWLNSGTKKWYGNQKNRILRRENSDFCFKAKSGFDVEGTAFPKHRRSVLWDLW